VNSLLSEVACKIITYYQSKGGGSKLFNIDCNFEPTCSEYAKQAIRTMGLFAAIPYVLDRLKRCSDPDKVERESDPFVEEHNV
tara:strand:+ start:1157 stop:1405 length:249 start_codon:yes stop_codon:yes gene_type:complete